MKKVLFMLAAAALVLVGCGPTEEVSKITSISINESITLLAGAEAVPLDLFCEPSTEILLPNQVEWTSSDETIVTVDDEGNVQGVAKGEAIVTAKYKELAASCAVTVLGSVYESISFNFGAHLQSPLGLVHPGPFYLTNAEGKIDTCGLALARCPIFSDNFYVDSEGYIQVSGTGFMADAYTFVYYILSEGVIYGSRKGYEIMPLVEGLTNPFQFYGDCNVDDIKYYILPQAILDPEAYGVVTEKYYYTGETPDSLELAAYDNSVGYGFVHPVALNDAGQQTTYVEVATLGTGYYFEPRNEGDPRHYDFTIDWFTSSFSLAHVDEEETELVHPFTLTTPETVRYTLDASAGVPAPAKAPQFKGLKVKKAETFKVNANVK